MKNILSLGKAAVFAVGFAVASVQSSSATEVQYTYTGETGGGAVMGIQTSDYNGYALVGEFIMTSSTPGFTTPLLTYCTDVGAFLNDSYYYTPTAITGSAPTGVSPTWISGGIQNVATLWANDRAAASAGGALTTAGLQLAIWELLYNNISGGYNFNSAANNGFHITTSDSTTLAVESDAAGYLSGLSSLPAVNNVDWMAPTEPDGSIGGSQGLLYLTPGQTDFTAPDAASTLALLGMAMAGLMAVSRTFCRNQA